MLTGQSYPYPYYDGYGQLLSGSVSQTAERLREAPGTMAGSDRHRLIRHRIFPALQRASNLSLRRSVCCLPYLCGAHPKCAERS